MTALRTWLVAITDAPVDEDGAPTGPATSRVWQVTEDRVDEFAAALGEPDDTLIFGDRSLRAGEDAYDSAVRL